jgi:hypothetical protein
MSRIYSNFKDFFNDNSIHFSSGWGVSAPKDGTTHSTRREEGAGSVRRASVQDDEAGRSDKRIRDKRGN